MQPYTATHTSKFPAAVIGMRMPATTARVPAGPQRVLGKGEELFAEGDDAEYFYKVVSGAIRSYKLLSDGRRQIDAFHLEGDIFGLEAGSAHRFSAEAVGNAAVIAYRRTRLAALIEEDRGVPRAGHVGDAAQPRARPGPHAAARPQDRAGEDRDLPARHGAAHFRRRRAFRSADAAHRHRRPSGPHHRDRVAHAHPIRARRPDPAAGRPAGRSMLRNKPALQRLNA